MTGNLPVILLMGPTAAGKTDIAMRLAERGNMEIVSVDSALIYKGMDIGTAKPDADMRRRAPHFLVDIKDPAEAYSAAEFMRDAASLITEIHGRGHVPLLCGGTMLYFRAVTEGLSELPAADESIRQAIMDEAADKSWPVMHAQLRDADPEAAARIHPNDPQRIQRALEICQITGISMSNWLRQNPPAGLPYQFIKWIVAPVDRSVLHQRIEQRLEQMLAKGFVAEVERLRARTDLNLHRPSMRAVGYRQIWQYLDGEFDLEKARLKAVYATRQLAKRQLTWLRAVQGAEWFNILISADIDRLTAHKSIMEESGDFRVTAD